ncbi:MAG: tetratricopeptide repeat protein [Anaerolineaceae bacterium]|nr:tetratricopeptide repeat protein [Anaerolineaceae bacterium]
MTMAGQEKPALEILHDLLLHFSHIEDTYHTGIVAGNIAVAYESLGKKELAVKYFQQASECFEKTNSKDEQYHSLHSLALLYLKLGKKFQAITALNSALNIKPNASLKDRALRKLMKTVF